jgi:hypothetical protein
MRETRHVHIFEVNMNLIKKELDYTPRWIQCRRHRYHLEQTCSTGLLEVVERI